MVWAWTHFFAKHLLLVSLIARGVKSQQRPARGGQVFGGLGLLVVPRKRRVPPNHLAQLQLGRDGHSIQLIFY